MAEVLNGHLVYKGFEAWITVDGEPLPHFGVESNDERAEATAWIPSEAGKIFKVYYRKTFEDENGYWAKLRLDGRRADRRIHDNRTGKGIMEVKKMTHIEISPTRCRLFMFNRVQVTDDDKYLGDPKSSFIGKIQLLLYPANVCHGPSAPMSFADISQPRKIHERDKRKVVHQIKLSDRLKKPAIEQEMVRFNIVGQPVTFTFRYRSLDMLRADGIAPRPEPTFLVTEDDGSPQPHQVILVKQPESEVPTPPQEHMHDSEGTPFPCQLMATSAKEEETPPFPQMHEDEITPLPVTQMQAMKSEEEEEEEEVDQLASSSEEPGETKPAPVTVKKWEEEDMKPGRSILEVERKGEDDGDVDDNGITTERERLLMAELEEIRRQKRARRKNDHQAKKRVKSEHPPTHFKPGEIIDLTIEYDMVRPKKRVKKESKMRVFVQGEVIDLT